MRILSNSSTSLYNTLSAKVLRRNVLEPQNDQQNLYFDRETVKRRRHEEYLELKKKEEADPTLAEAFKRRRLEEKARKAEEKKTKEREEKEDESLMELELEGIRAVRKGSVHHHDNSYDDNDNNDNDNDDDDDDNDDDDDDSIPIYRGLKDRVPCMLAIVSGGADGNLVIYNVESRREVNTFKLMGFPGFYNPVVSVSEHHACLIVCNEYK